MIQLKNAPGDRWLEIGAGNKPTLKPTCLGGVDVVTDVQIWHDDKNNQLTDCVVDLEKPFLLQSEEFDGVVGIFCLEHVSYRNVRATLKECFRVIKPMGRVCFVIPNTLAQMKWIQDNPDGWDGREFFESASGLIFGDLDYEANSHKAFFTPDIISKLLMDTGFQDVLPSPYGARNTDMVVTATRPIRTAAEALAVDQAKSAVISTPNAGDAVVDMVKAMEGVPTPTPVAKTGPDLLSTEGRKDAFDKHYFNGGGKVGGYAREGLRDFPVHAITAKHVLMRRPKSVLEIGAGRGYIGKRLEDAGVPYTGLEISKHCWMTRVSDGVQLQDLCQFPWIAVDSDLSFSIATLEHIPEQFVLPVLRELGKTCKRHLHGIDFGGKDDGFDKTHCTLRDKAWWEAKFKEAGIEDAEIVDKEALEQWHGGFPQDVLESPKKRLCLNLGSFQTMYHGWVNVDQHDLANYAQGQGYQFLRADLRAALPFNTGDAYLIHLSHVLEHFPINEGIALLKECRRLIAPDGVLRIAVPDAQMLMDRYVNFPDRLTDFDEISDGCEKANTPAKKLWELLHSGHAAIYDRTTLRSVLEECGWVPTVVEFRSTTLGEAGKDMLKGTLDMHVCLSLYCEAKPLVG